MIPKEEDSQKIDQFRMISLLSVEGKIFFRVVARWLSDFLSRNNCIDTLVQKWGIAGVYRVHWSGDAAHPGSL